LCSSAAVESLPVLICQYCNQYKMGYRRYIMTNITSLTFWGIVPASTIGRVFDVMWLDVVAVRMMAYYYKLNQKPTTKLLSAILFTWIDY
jgi:hypothetical protein